MALHYILDGYNIIKSVDFWADCSLEQGRQELIKSIMTQRLQGSARNDVMVVFDGKSDFLGKPSQGVVKVVFTSDETADDYIKHVVENSTDVKNTIVVSNDGEIVCYIRKLGAKALSVQEFLRSGGASKAGKKNLKGSSVSREAGKPITRGAQNKINEEFKDVWIHKKGLSD